MEPKPKKVKLKKDKPKDKKCYLCGKGYLNSPGTKLFSFPKKNQNLRKIWLETCDIDNESEIKRASMYLCQDHFDKDCVSKRKLRKNSVPTLGFERFIDLDEHKKMRREKMARHKSFCALGCKRYTRLFLFPIKDEHLRQVWLSVCNIKLRKENQKWIFICENHFLPNEIGKKKLKKGVIPSRFLNYDDNLKYGTDRYEYVNDMTDVRHLEITITEKNQAILNLIRKLAKQECAVEKLEKQNLELKKEMGKAKKTILNKQHRIDSLRTRIKENIVQRQIINLNHVSNDAKTFCLMLLEDKRKFWPDYQKKLAKLIYRRSSCVYKFFRDELNFHLPSISYLRASSAETIDVNSIDEENDDINEDEYSIEDYLKEMEEDEMNVERRNKNNEMDDEDNEMMIEDDLNEMNRELVEEHSNVAEGFNEKEYLHEKILKLREKYLKDVKINEIYINEPRLKLEHKEDTPNDVNLNLGLFELNKEIKTEETEPKLETNKIRSNLNEVKDEIKVEIKTEPDY